MRRAIHKIDRWGVNMASWLVARFFIGSLYYRDLVKSRFPTTDFMLAEVVNTLCYKLKLDRVMMAPRYIFIEPTNTCNIQCVMCPVPNNSMMTRKRKMLALDRLGTILEANPQLKIVYLTNWGEPLLHKQIVEIIRICASRGLTVVMTSNATLMTPVMAKQVLEAGLGVVRFSLDGVDEYFEKIRSVKYDTVAKNIEGFLVERNRGGYKTRVELNVTYMPENLPGVKAVHSRWNSKVDFINYQGVISIPTIKISNRKDHADRRPGCRQIYRSAFFLTNGSVAPCCADFNGELVLGEADTVQSAFTIMNSPKARELRRMHRKGELPTICAACTQYSADIFPRQQSSVV